MKIWGKMVRTVSPRRCEPVLKCSLNHFNFLSNNIFFFIFPLNFYSFRKFYILQAHIIDPEGDLELNTLPLHTNCIGHIYRLLSTYSLFKFVIARFSLDILHAIAMLASFAKSFAPSIYLIKHLI